MKASNQMVRCSALTAVAFTAHAAGIELYEIATPDVGLASAGYASRAQDPSTLFKNPAGMSLLEGFQVQAGAQVLYGDVEFTPNSDTSARLGTDGGGNAIGFLPALSLFTTYEISEKFAVGFGMASYFGLFQQYDDNWVGRYYIQEGGLVGVSLLPTVSYKINSWLSIGAGLNAMYGYLKNELAVNNPEPGFGDGELNLDDRTWGFGANAGVLIQASEATRFGITYLSQVKLNFEATPEFSHLGPVLSGILSNPPQLDLGMTVPQSVMVGVYHQLSPRWALMADVGWQNWEQFGKVDVGVASEMPRSLTKDLNYQNTWHGAVGAQFQVNPQWQLTGGFAYDSSAVSSEDRTVTVPMGKALRFGVGVQWQVSSSLSLNAAYEFLWSGDMSVDQGEDLSLQGRVAGAYDDTWFSFFTVNLTWSL